MNPSVVGTVRASGLYTFGRTVAVTRRIRAHSFGIVVSALNVHKEEDDDDEDEDDDDDDNDGDSDGDGDDDNDDDDDSYYLYQLYCY